MNLWLDAQLSPHLAAWISDQFEIQAQSLKILGLRDATDREIFAKAAQDQTVILTKDEDFVHLLIRNGPPPQIVWLRCGNVSNRHLKKLFKKVLPETIEQLRDGHALLEIRNLV